MQPKRAMLLGCGRVACDSERLLADTVSVLGRAFPCKRATICLMRPNGYAGSE